MSGFEIAGVVLGAIPLLVTAMQSYADGVSTIKSVFQYEEVYLDIHASLVVSLTIFQHSCEELLRGMLLPDSQFCALIDRHEGWDDRDLAKRLRTRMGDRDYQVYSKFATRLRKRILLLGEKLQLRSDFTPIFVVNGKVDEKKRKQFFKSPITRMRGAFEAGKLKKLVTEIGNDIEKLRELCKGSMDLEEERHERATASTSAYWLSMRDHACRLFSALQSIWPEKCQSHNHRVNLRVGVPATGTLHEDLASTQLCFHLEKADKTVIGRDVIVHSSLAPETDSGSKRKKARFILPPSAGHEPTEKCQYDEKIRDLCTVLIQDYQKPCLGFLPIQKWHYHVHNTRDWPDNGNLLPLRRLFATRSRIGVTPRERCVYSIMLASAVMQLFDTPWLKDSWSLEDVYVDRKGDGGQVYIPKLFNKDATITSPLSKPKRIFVKNEMVFALGVALLELTYGKEIRSFKETEDLDENNQEHAFTLYSISDRLTREVQRFETPRFAHAVAKCICPASDTYDFELSNDGYRNRFYLDVLQPLQQEYETLIPRR